MWKSLSYSESVHKEEPVTTLINFQLSLPFKTFVLLYDSENSGRPDVWL